MALVLEQGQGRQGVGDSPSLETKGQVSVPSG